MTLASDGAANPEGPPPGPSRGSLAMATVVLVVLALLAVFAVAVRRPATAPLPGQAAPDFQLIGYDGQPVNLADLRGKVVLLNFWASWCLPCAAEAAELEAIWRDYQHRGLVVVGVAYTDTDAAAKAYLARHGVSYPNAPDRQARVSRDYHVSGVPETFLLDRAGRIVPLEVAGQSVAKLVGPLTPEGPLSAAELRRRIEEQLAEGSG